MRWLVPLLFLVGCHGVSPPPSPPVAMAKPPAPRPQPIQKVYPQERWSPERVESFVLAWPETWKVDLGTLRSSAVPVLIRLLSDRRALVRERAALALRYVGFDALPSLSELSRVVTRDPDPGVRREAALALGSVGWAAPSLDLEPLIAALERDSDPGVRSAAAIALGGLGVATPVTPVLTHLLRREPHLSVRVWLISALSGLEDPRPLLDHLLQAEEEFELEYVVSHLVRMGEPAVVAMGETLTDDGRALRTELQPLGTPTHASARKLAVILALRKLGHQARGATPFLVYALLVDPDVSVRISAGWTLEKVALGTP